MPKMTRASAGGPSFLPDRCVCATLGNLLDGHRMLASIEDEERRMAQLGMVGLGRMGANLVRRLMRDGHDCVVYDVNADPIKRLEGEGAITDSSLKELAEVLEKGDAIIDGGNSYYRDDIRRAQMVREKGIDYIDCGTSGGVFG